MSHIWDSLVQLQNQIIEKFEETGTEIQEEGMDRFNQPGWVNRVWSSDAYRRAHIDVVDARETRGLWMMHVCVFPHLNSNAPIYGFDVIAGKKKMTGAFHDFSPTTAQEHPMITEFAKRVGVLKWKRERELPEWAKAIFTDSMMAAGNVNNEDESDQVQFIVLDNLDYFLKKVGRFNGTADPEDGKEAQNRYAKYQKMNPHTPRVMKSLGLDEDDVDAFVQKCLFPDL